MMFLTVTFKVVLWSSKAHAYMGMPTGTNTHAHACVNTHTHMEQSDGKPMTRVSSVEKCYSEGIRSPWKSSI